MQQSCGRKCLLDARCQRRMGRLIQADRRATLTEITTRYNQGRQQSICEATTRTTLRWIGYNSRRHHTGYHSFPLQIGKRGYNLKELAKIGQLKTGKMLPGLMSLDFCWDIQIELEFGMNRMTTWIHHGYHCAGWCCNGVGMFSWHTLGPIGHCLNAMA